MKPHHNLVNRRGLSLGLLAVTAALSASAADYPTTVSGLNPIGYWRFNETVASPSLDSVADSAGSSTGYVVGPVTNGAPGIVGNCVRLGNPPNSGTYVTAGVDVPWNATINPNAPFTVEFWVNPADTLGTDGTGFCPLSSMSSYFFNGASRSGWLFYVNNVGKWQLRVGGENLYVATPQNTNSAQNAAVGSWQHITGVFDGTTASLYVNGTIAAAATAGPGFKANGWTFLRIGGTSLAPNGGPDSGTPGTGNRGFDGSVDEVAVYATALSPNTIAAHYRAASTNNAGYHAQILADGPVGYWELEEPAFVPPDPSTFPSAANIGTAGADITGTNLLGALANQPGVPYAGFPAGNKSVFFSGEAGNTQLPDLASGPELGFTGPLTLMAWIKPTEYNAWRSIIAHGYDNGFAETYLRIGDTVDWEGTGNYNTAYYEVGATTDGGTYHSATYPVPAGDIGNWVFIAGTWDGANWKLYRNGQLVGTAADDTGPANVTNRWSIGSRSDPTDLWGMRFSGWIDEPAILSTALSASTIQNLYLSALVPPVITQGPQIPAGPIYEGSSLTLTVVAEGNPTLAYQWTKNGSPLGGQTTTALTLNNLTVANSGTYAVVVTNNYGSATGSVALVVQTSPPLITSQPQPASRFVGAHFVFSVGAIGSAPLSYQWRLAGNPISGATLGSYTNIASLANAGNYTCTVTNQYGSSNSAPATLTVLSVPSGYPSTIVADGPIAYYRLDESSGTVAHDYAGGNDGTYHGVSLGQPGYSIIDSDTAISLDGGVNHYVGQISPTGINFQGTSTAFSIEAWVNGAAGQTDGAGIVAKGTGASGTTANEQFCLDIAGGNFDFFVRDPSAAIKQVTAGSGPDGAWHHVVATYDSAGNAMIIYVDGQLSNQGGVPAAGVRQSTHPVSIGAKRSGTDPNYDLVFNGTIDEVAVYNFALSPAQVANHYAAAYGPSLPPQIAVQPSSVTNYVTYPVTFTVGAAGSVPLTYQWRKNGVDLSDNGIITGSSTRSLSINPVDFPDAGNYLCHITNPIGATNTVSVSLTVLAPPSTPLPIAGLVLHLPFDNNLSDVTGRGNNGTGVGGPTFAIDGMLGQGLHFSTETSNNISGNPVTNASYVTLGVRPDLQFSSNISFSVSYWIREPAFNGVNDEGDLPFFTDTLNSTFGTGWVFAPSYKLGGWAYSVYDANGNGVGAYGGSFSLDDGNWHHLVHVIDRIHGAQNYLDGRPTIWTNQAGTSVTAVGDLNSANPAAIGQDPSGAYTEPGSGDIDDLGVWHKALTPLEVAGIYMGAISNHVSYVGAPITLTSTRSGSTLILSWNAGMLQSADNITGPWINVTPNSPYTAPTPTTTPRKFYRVKL